MNTHIIAGRPATVRTRPRCSAGRSAGRRPSAAAIGPVLWACALVVVIVVPGVLPSLLAGAPALPGTATSVRVGPADTLWSIASANPMPGCSTAQTVEEIRRANGLSDSRLSAGAVLRVPAVVAPDAAFAAADPPAVH